MLIVDKATCYVWVFLTASKHPLLEIIVEFLHHHGHKDGGSIRTDQGGELALSFGLQDLLLQKFHHTLEPTGADSPSQNGAVKIYNDKFAVRMRTLLFGSGFPAQYWSAMLLHSVYLHNRLVHSEMKKTLFKGYYGIKPNLAYLKLFGSRVCIKHTGDCHSKLNRHDFSGIFSAMPQQTKTLSTLTLTPAWSNKATTLNLMRPGTSSPHAHPPHSCYTILGWRPTPTPTLVPNQPPLCSWKRTTFHSFRHPGLPSHLTSLMVLINGASQIYATLYPYHFVKLRYHVHLRRLLHVYGPCRTRHHPPRPQLPWCTISTATTWRWSICLPTPTLKLLKRFLT